MPSPSKGRKSSKQKGESVKAVSPAVEKTKRSRKPKVTQEGDFKLIEAEGKTIEEVVETVKVAGKHGARRTSLDWESVHREYRAGQLSLREIGRKYDVTDTAIRKRAKLEGWTRDLTDVARKAAKSEVVRSVVRTELSREPQNDTETVKTFANRGARAIEGHLARAERLKKLADQLTTELETYMAGGTPTVTIFVAKADSPATILRTLSDTAERIAKIERQALNLDDGVATGSDANEKTMIYLPANGR